MQSYGLYHGVKTLEMRLGQNPCLLRRWVTFRLNDESDSCNADNLLGCFRL